MPQSPSRGCEERSTSADRRAGDRRETTLPAIPLARDSPLRIAINLILPKDARGACEFDVVRYAGKRTLGRLTFRTHAGT